MNKLLLLFTLLFSTFYGQEFDAKSINEDYIHDQIPIEAISYQVEDKLYIKPDKIWINEKGIYICHIQVPTLYSDVEGCYIAASSKKRWICINKKCSNYQGVFRSSNGVCPYCKSTGLKNDF